MVNLMDEIDKKLQDLQLPPISNVVNNKNSCIEYINNILTQYGNNVTIPFDSISSQYDFRVKHILFSFGLGIVLATFNDLIKKIDEEYKKYQLPNTFVYTWLTLCLYHDYGYYIAKEYRMYSDIRMIDLKHIIFNYNYCNSRYSKYHYCEYYKKMYTKHISVKTKTIDSMPSEVGDHGILGGFVLFDKLYTYQQKASELCVDRIALYQDVCYRIMEHNIWKNRLLEIEPDSFSNIDIDEPLLYLLSLVDTIEMTKKFCRYPDKNSDKNHSIWPTTLGSKIYINVTNSTIEIYYSDFKELLKKRKYIDNFEIFDNWISSIKSLSDWVKVFSYNEDFSSSLKIDAI